MTLEQQKQIERESQDAKTSVQTEKRKADTPGPPTRRPATKPARDTGGIMRVLMGCASSAARG